MNFYFFPECSTLKRISSQAMLMVAAVLISTLVISGSAAAQGTPNPAHPNTIYDLNQDGYVDGDDLNHYGIEALDTVGPIGRGNQFPVNTDNSHLDLNMDGWVDLCDALAIAFNQGHFNPDGTFAPRAPGECLMGDLNSDGLVDADDVDAFKRGRQYWQWWHWKHPNCWVPPIYTFGDIDMNGEVNLDDFAMLNLLRSPGVPSFEGQFPEDYRSSIEPPLPVGWATWVQVCGPGAGK